MKPTKKDWQKSVLLTFTKCLHDDWLYARLVADTSAVKSPPSVARSLSGSRSPALQRYRERKSLYKAWDRFEKGR